MISPELLRRYPFSQCIDDAQQKALAMIAEDCRVAKGEFVFKAGDAADSLYMLIEGSISLTIPGSEPHEDIYVAEINPGEPFGISSVLEEQTYSASAQATTTSRLLKMEAAELRNLFRVDCNMGYCMLRQLINAALERLHLTYIQLAAAQ
jgi:CRP/FNR family cyclic AMP-dependent transcriptional regulator